MPLTAADKRAAFFKLHESGCFVLPNPFDVGSAKALQHLGFKAIASTSAGFAWTIGKADNRVTVDEVCDHLTALCAAVEIPVNADFEGGFAVEPAKVAANVARAVKSGVAGLSIEDSTGNPSRPLYELPLAVERIRAARQAIDDSRSGVLLTGRAECYLVGHSDPLRESIRRLQAYSEAGAHVLYAPGPKSRDDIGAIVSAVRPKPVNILMGWNTGLRVPDLAEMGVRRISVGSSLARAAWTGFLSAAKKIAEDGSFAGFDGLTPYAELNAFFHDDSKERK
jgi:2-methylisocitrate lyase-like PEP mutase family enzyme